jgi:hypothetical protein
MGVLPDNCLDRAIILKTPSAGSTHYERAPKHQKIEAGCAPPLPGDGANQFAGRDSQFAGRQAPFRGATVSSAMGYERYC